MLLILFVCSNIAYLTYGTARAAGHMVGGSREGQEGRVGVKVWALLGV